MTDLVSAAHARYAKFCTYCGKEIRDLRGSLKKHEHRCKHNPKVVARCRKHPKYRAIYKPRCQCKECWKYYARLHSDEKITMQDLLKMSLL
jgi:hypothetical protein